MKTPRFEYHAPDTLEEALGLLAEHGDEARILAGGQSLIPLMAMRLARPEQLVDLNRVASLRDIDVRGSTVALGAMCRDRQAERSVLVRERAPLLADALPLVGHVAIRNRGTVGGSLAHADPSAELPAVAVTLDAELGVASARGERTVSAHEFFLGHFSTALAADECLVEVRFPSAAPGCGWSFQEVARRHGDFALAGVAAMVDLDGEGSVREARIALLGMAPTPLRARKAEASLVGAPTTAATFAAAAAEATSDLEPASDVHGSAAFRRHLAAVTVRRALTTAAERAGAAT